MTPDDSVIEDQPNPVRTSAAQIEQGIARFRAGYLIWKQQRAVAEDRPAEGEKLPRKE